MLESPDSAIILDTKFYRDALQHSQYSSAFHSAHLYQIFAYLKSAEVRRGPFSQATGILLYPAVGNSLDEHVDVEQHTIRVMTLDLAQEWRGIHEALLGIIGDF